MGCGASVFQEIKLHFNFFLDYELCKLCPKTTLHDPFLTVLIGYVSLAGYLLSDDCTQRLLSRGGSPQGSTAAPALPLRRPLMVCADCPSTDWLAVVCQESFLHASSGSLVWSEVSLIPEREKRINGPPLQRSLVGFQLLS